MSDVGAQILDRRIRGLLEVIIGMVHVPEGAHAVAGETVQDFPEQLRIGKDAGGLDEERHAVGFGKRQGDMYIIKLVPQVLLDLMFVQQKKSIVKEILLTITI